MNYKRLIVALLAMVMVLCLSVVAFAETDSTGVKITHISLDPTNDALGFKAKVEGDFSAVTEIGFSFRVDGNTEKVYTLTKTPENGVFTARVHGILENDGGEATLEAYAFVRMGDVTVKSRVQSTSMKKTLGIINKGWYSAGYSTAQKNAVKTLCETYKTQVEAWELNNVFGSGVALTTNYFADGGHGAYTLTTDSDAQHLVDDVTLNGEVLRSAYYSLKGKLTLTDAGNWGQARVLISADGRNEYVIALEKTDNGAHQIFTMSKTNQDSWDRWELLCPRTVSGERNALNFEIVADGQKLYFLVDDLVYYTASHVGLSESTVKFTGLNAATVTVEDLSLQCFDTQEKAEAYAQTKALRFGETFGFGQEYVTTPGFDLSEDKGANAAIQCTGGAPQYAYLNGVFTNQFVFETSVNVQQVLNNDGYPKFGLLVNGGSEMVKFFVDMNPAMTASHVGVVYQPTGGGDDWGGSRSVEVPGMAFAGNDTVKLKLIRDGSAYWFYVNGVLALGDDAGFHDENGAVGIFSFNTVLTASDYSVDLGPDAEGFQGIGMTTNWFATSGDGVYTLTTDSDAQHKVDDLLSRGDVVRKSYYRVGGKLTLSNANDWGQARILISSDAQNEYVIALEKLPAGNYQIFTMSKANQESWDNWTFMGNTGKNTHDFEVVANGNKLYFLLDNLIWYETDRVNMAESTVKFTGLNVGTTTVENLSLEVFADSNAANAYISGKEYKIAGVQETELSTHYFTQSAEGVYTLTTNSDAQHLVDDVLANGLMMRNGCYSLQGKLTLTNADTWGQARILISADAQNEYVIALEKLPSGSYQVFTMSKANQEGWDNWTLIGNTGRNSHDFEVVVGGNQVYFLLDGLVCYETERVNMAESTVKFTGLNVGTTTVENLQLKTFADGNAVNAYIADKEYKTFRNPETLLSTNYFTGAQEGVYTLSTDSDAQHLVDDVLADTEVMRTGFYSVKGHLSLTDAADWGQARILISADPQNEYFIALEKLPSGNCQIFSMSKANQENWDVWEAIVAEDVNGTRNGFDFEVIVLGGEVNLLIDGQLAYKTTRVAMTESTLKFTGFNVGTTTVADLEALRFADQADAEAYLADRTLTQNQSMTYKNTLATEGADPGVLYITEGKDAGSYYMYVTSDTLGCTGYLAYRSKDLVDWECVSTALSAGESYYDAASGHTVSPYLTTDYWAPEVIYDAQTKLYYMFYNADRYDDAGYFYGDIAVSADPAGPFVPYNKYLGKGLVQIDAENDIWAYEPVFVFPEYMKIIDLNPFVDPVTGQKYVYFCQDLHTELEIKKSSIYVMKLDDDYTPDYSSVTALTTAEKLRNEGAVNEAPFVVYNADSGMYYLLYSANRYYQASYCVRVAVGESPEGPFTKLTEAEGGYLLTGNDLASGTGHCSVVNRDGQAYMVYHAHKEKTDDTLIRGIAMDELHWVRNSSGILVPVVNGPSVTAMPLTAEKYVNVASQAAVTATGSVSGTVSALNDGVINQTAVGLNGGALVRLQFEKAQALCGIAVYNGYEALSAGIQSVRLVFANGQSVVYSADAMENGWLQMIPVNAVAVEIQMQENQVTASEIVLMTER